MKIKIKDHIVLIDDEDFSLISEYSWHLNKCSNTIYCQAHIKGSRPYKKIQMHRLIMGVNSSDIEVDHKNHIGLDNRKSNLRSMVKSGNKRNTTRKNKTGYMGVRKLPSGRYQSQIRIDGRQKHLGVFDLPEDAHIEYMRMHNKMLGEETIIC